MKKQRLTHDEACQLVEQSLERVKTTLEYIKQRLDQGKHPANVVQECDKANLLCNINWYGAYLKGASAMYRNLKDQGYLDIPKENIDTFTPTERRIVNKSKLDLYMESSVGMEYLLGDLPDDIVIRTSFDRNNKGKVVGADSAFVYRKDIKWKKKDKKVISEIPLERPDYPKMLTIAELINYCNPNY